MSGNSKTACAYIRVSTRAQEELSPAAQKRLIEEFCQIHNYTLDSKNIFQDNGISGKKADKRPEFLRMIALAKSPAHPFDVILVWKYSRFARNQEESIVYKSMLRRVNVEVISVSEPLDDSPFSSLIERIIEWMDEYYSIRLSGEVTRGMREHAMHGGYNSAPPFGYRSNLSTGIPEKYNPEGEIYLQIIHMFLNEKRSLRDIALALNFQGHRTRLGKAFEVRTLRYILLNPFYAGYIRWNYYNKNANKPNPPDEWIVTRGQHESYITDEQYNDIQKFCKNPATTHNNSTLKHPLSGRIKCSACGSTLSYNRTSDSFQCSAYSKGRCSESHYVKAYILEKLAAGKSGILIYSRAQNTVTEA